MWTRQTLRWLLVIGSLWSFLAIFRSVLHQSLALQDGTDSTTAALLNLAFGVYYGAWLVLCQKLVFSAESLMTRLVWASLAVAGLWGLSPASQELLLAAQANIARSTVLSDSAADLQGVSYWLLGLGVAASLWLARPLFRDLLIRPAAKNEATTPLLREPAPSPGLLWHPWVIRIVVLVGCSYWLKSNMDLRQHPSAAYSFWLLLLIVISVGSIWATIPYYLAITMRRRGLGFAFFHIVWLGAAGVLSAMSYVFQTWWPVLPHQVVVALAEVFAPWLVGFSFSQLIAFWSGCYFRDRAILVIPAVIVAQKQRAASADLQTSDSTQTSVMVCRWPQCFGIAVMAMGLFAAVHGSSLFLQHHVHLGTWWLTDQNHWNRATSLARLQQLQDSDVDIARSFTMRNWRYDRPLLTSFSGTVQCVVSANMASDPAWKPLRKEIELNFKDVFWTMDFPISDPTDVCGSAHSVLKIDGETLRLRDLPGIVYPYSWEIFGGTIEDSDYVRGSGTNHLGFHRCEFGDIDFRRPVAAQYQVLTFTDCTFRNLPRFFPERVRVNYILSRPAEFVENHESFIEALFNGSGISLRPANSSTFDGNHLLTQIPKPWRQLIRISNVGDGQSIAVEREPLLSLYTTTKELPANFDTRILETNESGKIIGLDFRQWQWNRQASQPMNDDWNDGSALNWFRTLVGTDYELEEPAGWAALLGRSWLLQVQDVSGGSRIEQLIDKLTIQNFVDSGKAFYAAERPTLLDLDLLTIFPNRDTLIVDCQTWPPGFTAGLVKVPQLKRVVVLIAGAAPDATEAVDIQLLPAVEGIQIDVLRRPNTTGELVRLLRNERDATR